MLRVASVTVLVAVSAACGSGGSSPAGAVAVEPGALAPSGSGPVAAGAAAGGDAPTATAGGEAAPSPELPLGAATPAGGEPGAAGLAAAALPRSTPEAEGLSSEGVLGLVAALDSGAAGEIHSMMLVRHGKVVAEGFWAPYAPEDIHVLYSVTKSINATAVGFAVDEGLLSVDDLLVPYFADRAPAQVDPELAAMKIRDLLTMSTGYATDSIDAMRQRSDGQWTRSFLEGDVQQPPGAAFRYDSGAAYMLGALVQSVTGTTVAEYLGPRLFEPLGMGPVLWGQSAEGVSLGDGGLSLRTESLAKLGLLYLQGGAWNGEQILSPEWASAATAEQISTGNGDGNWSHGYGYQFWRSRVGYRADGSLGQFGFVLPDQDIVLAITAATNDTNGVMNLVWDNLLPAVVGEPQPESPAALAGLSERLAALSLPLPSGAPTSPLAADVSGLRHAAAPNAQGLSAVTLDFSGATPVLVLEDADGAHQIQVGVGQWVRQRTGYKKRINELFDTPDQGLAAAGAWLDESTFVARLCFNETPYTMTATFAFEGEQVRINMSYNVRWGATSEPELVATR